MVQVLCYTGRGFDTCWRPGSVARNMVENAMGDAVFSPIRFFKGDFV